MNAALLVPLIGHRPVTVELIGRSGLPVRWVIAACRNCGETWSGLSADDVYRDLSLLAADHDAYCGRVQT